MTWPKTGTTHYHAQLGLQGKGRAIKVLVVCYIVWLDPSYPIKVRRGLRACARCEGLVPCYVQDGYQAQAQYSFKSTVNDKTKA